MTDMDTKLPEFAVSFRGYDRVQVDDYVAHLQWLVADAEQRAQLAEADARASETELKALREVADARRRARDHDDVEAERESADDHRPVAEGLEVAQVDEAIPVVAEKAA